jgi:subtilisin-like proprotein convertase family protein/subtilisin family serine protease
MGSDRSHSRKKLRPIIERLELRQLLAADFMELPELKQQLELIELRNRPAEYSIEVDNHEVGFYSHPRRLAVGFKTGEMPDSFGEGRFVRTVTNGVGVFEWLSPITSNQWDEIRGRADVNFAEPVLVSSDSLSEAVLISEVIVALQPGVDADNFFDGMTEVSSYRELPGTDDQFVVSLKESFGAKTIELGNEIAEQPGVAWTSPNFYQSWQKQYFPNDPRFGNLWHLHNVGQGGGLNDADADLPEAWDITPGGSGNIAVAVIDDGVQSNHPDLDIWVNPGEIAGNAIDDDGNGWVDDINGWNFVLDTNASNPAGTDAHGTAVGGVAAARGDNALGVTGAAYRSKLISIKMFDGALVASDANIAAALYYAAGRTRNGAATWRAGDVVNNSWGGGANSAAINAALAWGTTLGRQGAGATMFFATGNDYATAASQPAAQSVNIPGVIAVGATNNFGERSDYSNYGTALNIVAPSNDLRTGYLAIDTTDRTGADGYAAGDYTGTGAATGFGGTSSATPLATGIGALVLARAQALSEAISPAQLRGLLQNSTDLLNNYPIDINTGKNVEVGFGKVNANAAVLGVGVPEISVITTATELQSGAALSLGSAYVGNSVSTTIRIRNQGTRALLLSDLSVAAPFTLDPLSGSTTLAVGEARTLTVRFLSANPGVFNRQLTISNNDSDESSFVLNLSATALVRSVSGDLYEDFAGDGLRAPSDIAIANSTGFAYADLNNNSSFDTGEPRGFATAAGAYEITNLAIGSYTIRSSVPGWTQSGPVGGSYAVTISTLLSENPNRHFGFARNGRGYLWAYNDTDVSGTPTAGETGVSSQPLVILGTTPLVGSNTTAVPIPDLGVATSSIVITAVRPIIDVNVTVNLPHSWMSDMTVVLISPSGTRITLASGVGFDADGFVNTTFDDQAVLPIASGAFPYTGSFRPAQPLAVLNGGTTNGTWRLEVSDTVGFDVGTISSWSISFAAMSGGTTNAEGYFAFDLTAPTMTVQINPTTGWETTDPFNGQRTVTRLPGPTRGTVFGLIFGNYPPMNISPSVYSIEENRPLLTQVGTMSTTDPNRADTSFTYSLVAGSGSTNNSEFSISGNRLLANAIFDFESATTKSIRVRTRDAGGLTFERAITINIVDVNEGGTQVSLSGATLPENQQPNVLIGTISTNDPDAGDVILYQLDNSLTSHDNGLFRIVGDKLYSAVTFDFESRSSYQIRIRTLDKLEAGLSQDFSISLSNVNESPTGMVLSNSDMLESAPIGASIGTIKSLDPDTPDQHTLSLVTGAGSVDNDFFEVSGSELRVKHAFDFESKRLMSARVRTTDTAGLWFESVFLISIINVNESPTDLGLSSLAIDEGLAIGTSVGTLSAADQDLFDRHQFEFASTNLYPDNNAFRIDNNVLRSAAVFNFDTKNSFVIRLRALDQGGLSREKDFTVSVRNVNDPPTDVGLTPRTVAENTPSGTLVGTLSTIDMDGSDVFQYALVPGDGSTDNSSFTIVGNELRTNRSFDFESKSIYSIRVQSRDSGQVTIEKVFEVSVANVNEAPTSISSTPLSILENSLSQTPIGTFSTTDVDAGETFTYALVTGLGDVGNSLFTLSGNVLRSVGPFDFEVGTSYPIRVRSTDRDGLFTETNFVVAILNMNESPFGLTFGGSVPENVIAGTVAGSAVAQDPDAGDLLTYTLVSGIGGEDNALVSITSRGVVSLALTPNFESKSSYFLRIAVTDSGGLTSIQNATLTISDVNEAPTNLELSSASLLENAEPNHVVGKLLATDEDNGDSHSFALVPGVGSNDNDLFKIEGSSLIARAGFDFETKNSYAIRIAATDVGGLELQRSFVIRIEDVNEVPISIELSDATIAENSLIGTTVGNLSTEDADAGESFTYQLISGSGDSDNAGFLIVGSALVTATELNFEVKNSYSIRVQSTDSRGLSVARAFTVTILDSNDLPEQLTISSSEVAENSPLNTLIGTLSAIDQDFGDSVAFRFDGTNNDNDGFVLSGINGAELRTNTALNFEQKSQYRLSIQAYDRTSNGPIQSFGILITDSNESPSQLTLTNDTIVENLDSDTFVGTISALDPDANEVLSYALVAGLGDDDNALFSLDGDQLRFQATADFEIQSGYTIRISATDRAGERTERAFQVQVLDANEAPRNLVLSQASLAENSGNLSFIGDLSASDPDTNDQLTFSIVSGGDPGSPQQFAITGSQLLAIGSFNFERDSTASVRVKVTDQRGLSMERDFVISIIDVPEAPSGIQLSATSIVENIPVGSLVGKLSTLDEDSGDTFVYRFVGSNASSLPFSIVGNEIRTTGRINYESLSQYSLEIRSTDSTNRSVDMGFEIIVSDMTEISPTAALDRASTPTNQSVLINVLQNDSDTDGVLDPSTVVIVGGPTAGTVSILSDGRILFAPPSDLRGTYTFTYAVRDNHFELSNPASVSVRVHSAFQNQLQALDADADGDITPLDVLTVINDINFNGVRVLPNNVPETAPYIDTDGDGSASPLDVLEIINFLNSRSISGAEGESSSRDDRYIDDVFATVADFRRESTDSDPFAIIAVDEYYRDLSLGRSRRR